MTDDLSEKMEAEMSKSVALFSRESGSSKLDFENDVHREV